LVSLPDDVLQQVGLGDHVGKNWQIPVHTASEIQKMADEGNTIISANGRMVEVNKRTNKVIRDFGAATPVVVNNLNQGPLANTPNIPAGATGDAALAQMDPRVAKAVKLVGEYGDTAEHVLGRANPAARTNFYAALTSAYPDYRRENYDAQHKTYLDYSPGGVIGQQVQAFNTSIRHLGGIADAADRLNNSDFQDVNKFLNVMAAKIGRANVTNFNTFRSYLAGELAKALGGGVPTDASRAEANTALQDYYSPAQTKGAIKTVVSLMRGKLSTQEAAYQQATGRTKKLVDPGAQAVLDHLGVANEGTDGGAGQKNDYSHLGFVPLRH
jgi:hypothetical protein